MIMRALLSFGLVGSVMLTGEGLDPRTLSVSANPAVTMAGDTTRIAYAVTNSSTSTQELFAFTVDAPAPAFRVERPAATLQWHVTSRMAGRSVASWTFIEHQLAPGSTSPHLAYAAVGLPGIVRYWARIYVAPDTVEPADVPLPRARAADGPVADDSGSTVGVVPFPEDRSAGALLARLTRLITQTCTRAWVDDPTVCTELHAKIRRARTAFDSGQVDITQRELHAFVRQVNSEHGDVASGGTAGHVNGNAHALLRANALYVLSLLPADAAADRGTSPPPER
jgi:hypothetical protein